MVVKKRGHREHRRVTTRSWREGSCVVVDDGAEEVVVVVGDTVVDSQIC